MSKTPGRTAAPDFAFLPLPGDGYIWEGSQAGGGDWGASDDVIVKARNGVVVDEVQRALEEGCRSIMITYGALHMQVISRQLAVRAVRAVERQGDSEVKR